MPTNIAGVDKLTSQNSENFDMNEWSLYLGSYT